MNTKFKLTKEFKMWCGIKLWRIKALKDFGTIKKGELGGFVEKRENLSEENNAWVYGDAQVYGDAWVYGDAQVFGDAWVSGDARVFGNAWVFGDAWVSGNARVFGNAWVSGELSFTSGYFFGMKHKGEDIQYIKQGDNEIVCKGNVKVENKVEEKITELTMDEIANKFGVDIKNLKIKK